MSHNLPEVAMFGCIPRDESLMIPSRHLGLVTAEDNPLPQEFLERLADMAERCLDLDGLAGLKVNSLQPPFCKGGSSSPSICRSEQDVRIAVARDAAFCFVYEDNLRLLRETGAEIINFSPLEDSALPPDISGIYLPGGYPELYSERLAANVSMKDAIRNSVAADMPVYAECGGFIYLTEGIEESEGKPAADFVGIFPVRTRMLPRRKALGYRQAELKCETVIGSKGAVCRGHEFHYSEIGSMPDNIDSNYNVSRQGVLLGTEGYRVRECLASYLHLHFGSNPDIAPAFVEACRKFTNKQRLHQTNSGTLEPRP